MNKLTLLLLLISASSCLFSLAACQPSAPETALEHAEKHLNPTYVCPMHPQIIRDHPGQCPICGMTLVKKAVTPPSVATTPQPDTASAPAPEKYPAITLDPSVIQKLGVRTHTVKRGSLTKEIKTVGYVSYDENHLSHVHSRSEGWVESLKVHAEGDTVKRDQVLLDLYSPELLAAQEEFLISLKTSKSHLLGEDITPLKSVAQERLRLLKLPNALIERLIRSGKAEGTIPLLAPQTGIVTRLSIREGMYIMPSLELFTIADLSTVWVQVEVFEQQLAWIHTGQSAKIRVPALPDYRWEGQVDYIYPELNRKTRTLKARLRVDNPRNLLKPNMFVQAELYSSPKTQVLTVPQLALIVTGARESLILALGKGKFKPIDVTTGLRSQGEVEILSGLQVGDQVVISGQFLIDSESSLQASFQRFNSP